MNIKEILYFSSMDGDKFERLFILEAIRRGEEKYGNARSYGVAVWPDKEKRVAGQTMYNLRNTTKTGKPQSIRLHEAVRMVSVLDKGFASFCFEVSEKIRIEEETAKANASMEPLKNSQGKDNESPAPEPPPSSENGARDEF